MIANETVAGYLERLASQDPTPGGGAAAALHAAQGAALASMVARFTSGPKYAEVETEAAHIAERARSAMCVSLHAAQEDERLFGLLATAYRMPRGAEPERNARSQAIQQATLGATEPLVAIVQVADEVVQLAARLLEIGNRSVISDVAAAAESARAALAIAVATLEMNINALNDVQERERLTITARRADAAILQCEEIAGQLRVGVGA